MNSASEWRHWSTIRPAGPIRMQWMRPWPQAAMPVRSSGCTGITSLKFMAWFGTWLHRRAVNVILARRESLGIRRKRYLDGDTALETIPTRRPGPEMSMDFEAAMERLPEGAREVFVLHDVEGYRHEEIAQMLGLATGTSKSQLHRARMALRQHLER